MKVLQSVIDGSFEAAWEWPGPDWEDINNKDTSAVGFVQGPALSADNAARLDEFIAGLADGSIRLFTGPLNFQDGSVFLRDGETATGPQIWYAPQLLEGMEGTSQSEWPMVQRR